MTTTPITEYTHQDLGEDVQFMAGYYTPMAEVRLPFDGRDILYTVGRACVEAACCGSGSWGYAQVAGYVVSWKSKTSATGLPVSEVEPIRDTETQREIARVVREREHLANVDFW